MPFCQKSTFAEQQDEFQLGQKLQDKVNLALEKAGANGPQLQAALGHYREIGDAKGYKSCAILIALSQYRLEARYPGGQEDLEGKHPEFVRHCEVLTTKFIVSQVDERMKTRNGRYAWNKDVDDAAFYSSVLPYTGQTEAVPKLPIEKYLFDNDKFGELNLGISFEDFHKAIDGFGNRYRVANGTDEKRLVLEDLLFWVNTTVLVYKAGVDYRPRGWEDLGQEENFGSKSGRCTDLCHKEQILNRALGIPTVHERVHAWAGEIDNHTWLYVDMGKNGEFSIDGGCKTDGCPPDYYKRNGFGRTQHRTFSSVIREGAGISGLLGLDENAPKNPYLEYYAKVMDEKGPKAFGGTLPTFAGIYDTTYVAGMVGSDYYNSVTLKLDKLQPGKAYCVGVFNNGEFAPIAALEADRNGRAEFPNLNSEGITYALMEMKDGRAIVLGKPFMLDGAGAPAYAEGTGKTMKMKFAMRNADGSPRQAGFDKSADYGLYKFVENEGWVFQQKMKTGKTGKPLGKVELEEGALYQLRRIPKMEGGKFFLDAGVATGENYVLWGKGVGEDGQRVWDRAQTKKADNDGKITFDVQAKEGGEYSASHWYNPEALFFSLRDDGTVRPR